LFGARPFLDAGAHAIGAPGFLGYRDGWIPSPPKPRRWPLYLDKHDPVNTGTRSRTG
jgi:hypothetical protein